MTDPYEVLGLEPGCGETEMRRRYLELVRENPPDRQPERFAAIREAYDRLRDPQQRLHSRLFDLDTNDSLETILSDVRRRLRTKRIPLATLLGLAEQR